MTSILSRRYRYLLGRIKTLSIENGRQMSLMTMKPDEFVEYMKRNDVSRCYVVYNDEEMRPVSSDETLFDEMVDFCISQKHDYLRHEGFFLEIGQRTDTLMGAFVWRTNRGQGCGGLRLWEYDSMSDYVIDGLRLSYGMGVKSALAGLWAGGGKGVIASPSKEKLESVGFRKNLFLDYGDFLTSLNGCYIGAEDAGVNVSDLDAVHERSRFITCISETKGGSGNPSVATGKGIVTAMEASLDFLGLGTIEGKKIVSQGCGNVARIIIDTLLDKGVEEVYASDVNEQQLQFAESIFKDKSDGRLNLELVPRGETTTLTLPCDILSPNALGNVLNETTIPTIKSKIICGAANNQLGKPSDNKLLMDRGITYVVDFLCNRMGIVNCANETYGRLKSDPALLQHFSKDWPDSIWNVTQEVLQTVQETGVTPVQAATDIAERKSLMWHPIWPRRSQQIIQDLVAEKWAN